MSREVLTQGDYDLVQSGYLLDNSLWQAEIHRRLEVERKTSPVQSWLLGAGTVQLQSFELGSFEEVPIASNSNDSTVEPTEDEIKARMLEIAEAEARKIKEAARKTGLEITEQAHWEAQEILSKAKEEARQESLKIWDETKSKARLEGIAEGNREGLLKGQEEGSKSFEASVRKWDGMAQQLLVERNEVLSDMKPLLAELLEEALKRCLQSEAVVNKQMVIGFAEEAIQKAHDRLLLKLHVNPLDLTEFEANRQKLQLIVGSAPLELVADARIERGGCLLETEAGSIDARINSIVAQVKKSLELV